VLNIEITEHGRKRVRQRLGLPNKAIERHIKKVVFDGELISGNKEQAKYLFNNNLYIFFKKNNRSLVFCTLLQEKEENFHLYVGGKRRNCSCRCDFTKAA
jgi:hypothetical protein